MAQDELAELRRRIDEADERLVAVLSERFGVTRRVGQLKAELGMPPIDAQREAEVDAKVRRLAREHGLSEDLVSDVLRAVIDRVVSEHRAQGADARS